MGGRARAGGRACCFSCCRWCCTAWNWEASEVAPAVVEEGVAEVEDVVESVVVSPLPAPPLPA